MARIKYEDHGDLIRTMLQTNGKLRLYFLTLHDLGSAVLDLGIDPKTVIFRDGYAVVDPLMPLWEESDG